MELNNNVHAFNSSRYVHVRYRRSIALSCPNEASRFETSPIQLCASKFRLKKERNIRSRTSRSTFPTSPHFPIFPNSFSIHSLFLSLSRERIENSDSFGSGSLSRFWHFIEIIITNSFHPLSKWFSNFVIRDPSFPTSCFEYSVHESFFEM